MCACVKACGEVKYLVYTQRLLLMETGILTSWGAWPLKDETDRLSRNVGNNLPLYAA